MVVAKSPLSLDPLVDRADPAVRDVGQLLYRRVLRLDGQASPVGDLAQTWGVSGDGLSYRVAVRDGVLWSDGSRLTVKDVQATVALVQADGFPDAGLAASWHGVAVTPATDGTSVVTFTLPQPRAAFAAALVDLPILPAASVARLTPATLGTAASRPMPVSGPFQVAAADTTHVRLVPNRHAGVTSSLHAVDLRLMKTFDAAAQALAAGQVDGLVAGTPAQRTVLQHMPGVHVHDLTTFRFVDLLFNERRPGLDDPAVRRAVATAVDRKQLIASVLGGDARPQVGAIPAGIRWIAPSQQDEPSVALSARALDAAGWVAGGDGVRGKGNARLAYTLTVPNAPPLPAVAGAIASQLRGLGVALTINVVKPEEFEPTVLLPQNFDLVIADWDNGPDPDVSSFWRSNATPPHGFNVSGAPPDLFLDRALDSLATVDDPRLRRVAAGQVDARLAEDTPAVFLYAPEASFGVADTFDRVRLPDVGTSASRFDGIAAWRKLGV
ncbi:MAG TPA: ABC transporter substrate-binding protein [Candidatus Dormibacteraeota bacterium]|nr:ABC transporter substrate-binding protein [Candidatus Dormibacteraeota bacterium]